MIHISLLFVKNPAIKVEHKQKLATLEDVKQLF